MIGTVLRIALVVGWLGLYLSHVAHYALPGLGLIERRDLAAVLGKHLDHVLTYELQAPDDHRVIGHAVLSLQHDDTFYRLRLHATVDDRTLLGPAALLLDAQESARATTSKHVLVANMESVFDDHFRLISLDGRASLLGFTASGKGAIDHRGLIGALQMGDDHEIPFAAPEITPDSSQGIDLCFALPSGLQVGEQFSSTVLGFDMKSLRPRQRLHVYRVMAREQVPTKAGDLDLLRVVVEIDGQVQSEQWCDDHGVVYRVRDPATGYAFVLTMMRRSTGAMLWPTSLATGASTDTNTNKARP